MQQEQSYKDRTVDAESTIRDIVKCWRASKDQAFRSIQKATASGILHEWIETTDERGGVPKSYLADRARMIALVNAAMLDE